MIYKKLGKSMIKGIGCKKSIRTKQLIIFAVFMAVNVLFSMVLYFLATATVKKSIFDKMDAQADFYLETIDNHLKSTENMLYNMFSDRKLIFLVEHTNLLNAYELRDAYLSEQERIIMLKENNPLVASGIIYLPNAKMKISDSYITDMDADDFEAVRQKYTMSDFPLKYMEGSLFMSSSGVPVYQTRELPAVLFVVEFNEKKIKETLRNFNTIDNSGSFLYQPEQSIFIESGENAGTGNRILELLRPELEEKEEFSDVIKTEEGNYQISVTQSSYLGYFVQYAPEKEVLKNMESYKWLVFIYIIGVASVAVVFSESIEKTIHRPLNKLMEAFSKVEKENLSSGGTEYTGEDEFSYLFEGFNHMQDKTKRLIEELVLQKELAQQAELKQLQAQINPHFLYNSFFSLKNKIKREELEDAEKLASLLGTYFRFLTRNDENCISLKSEVEHARSYTDIQYMRFHDRIDVYFEELPKEYESVMVPRLILQPVIENALKYGLEEKEEGGMLRITFRPKEDILEIHVEDNGQMFTDDTLRELREKLEKTDEITGIINIHKRLKLYWGEKSGLEISRSSLGGAHIVIKIFIGK